MLYLQYWHRMKFSELYRLLQKDGWYIERTNKHHVFVHPCKPGTIPAGRHAAHEVPKGTLSSILKLANLNSR